MSEEIKANILKNLISGNARWIHEKHMNAFSAKTLHCLTYAMNDDEESLSVFPSLEVDGVRARLLVLKVNDQIWLPFQKNIDQESKQKLQAQFISKLPGLLHWLMMSYEPKNTLLNASFGCAPFIHPSIERKLDESTFDYHFQSKAILT